MKLFILIFLSITATALQAQRSCLTVENLKTLDRSWEQAQLKFDVETLEELLAEEFLWVHNHASAFDSKADVVEKARTYRKSGKTDALSRENSEVSVIILGNTGIVSGYATVDRSPHITTYHFMRTYVEKDGRCYLLANHTMALPKDD